jgi:hypothetical protein
MLRALLELSRVSNLPTVWTNVLAAWIIASGPDWRWTPALGWLLLGASLIYSAGMILNDACDAAWDRDHRPERPIPGGRIGLITVWAIGLIWLLGGAAIMILLGGASWLITLLLLAAIVAYDVYHKPWAGSVIVMGACRTLLYLAAGSAVMHPSFKMDRLVPVGAYGIILGLYIIALTRTARAEATGNVEGWNRWGLTVLLFLPIVPVFLRLHELPSPEGQSLFILPMFVGPVSYALAKMKQGGKAITEAVGWMLATIPAVDAMAIAPSSLKTAIFFSILPPLLRLWQRWIAAT